MLSVRSCRARTVRPILETHSGGVTTLAGNQLQGPERFAVCCNIIMHSRVTVQRAGRRLLFDCTSYHWINNLPCWIQPLCKEVSATRRASICFWRSPASPNLQALLRRCAGAAAAKGGGSRWRQRGCQQQRRQRSSSRQQQWSRAAANGELMLDKHAVMCCSLNTQLASRTATPRMMHSML